MTEFTRGPGYDWAIYYQFDDAEHDQMLVFGQITLEDALREARYSLDGINGMNAGRYQITGAHIAHITESVDG